MKSRLIETGYSRHITINVLWTVLGLIAYVTLTSFTNSLPAEDANNFLNIWSPLLLITLLPSLGLSLFVAFKAKGWMKVVAVSCALVNVLLVCAIAFFYVFVGVYAS